MKYLIAPLVGLAGFLALSCSSSDVGPEAGGGMPSIKLPNPGIDPSRNGTPGITDVPSGTIEELRNSSCAGWSAEPEALPSVLQLVVDVSSSMSQRAPGSDQNKWEVTREALIEAIVGETGPGLHSSIAVGLLFYPNVPDSTINRQPGPITGCVRTDAMVGMNILGADGAPHRELLRQAFVDVRLNRSTPTHDAYRYALNQGLLPTRFSGPKYMLLITDGTPTLSEGCVNPAGRLQGVDPRPIVEEIRRAAEQEVKTFLIGSPGSEENRTWMSEAARIGGTAQPNCSDQGPNYCHMDLTTSPDFSKALRDGLAHVASQIAACNYELPEPPAGEVLDQSRINVILTPGNGKAPQLIGPSADAKCSEGWAIKDGLVTICPKTCEAIQKDEEATLELLFGCVPVNVPQ